MSTTRIFLVDGHQVVRDGLRSIISPEPDLEVIGEADTCHEARNRILALDPDVVLADVNLADGDGIALCRHVSEIQPDVRCILFTAFDDDDARNDTRSAGAWGYLPKTRSCLEIIASIRTVASGERLLGPSRSPQPNSRSLETAALDLLSPRESDVFELLARGLTNRQMADELLLAEKTVKNYVSNLLMKLGLQRRTEAAALSARTIERREQRELRLG